MGSWFAIVAVCLLTAWTCAALLLDFPVPSLRTPAALAYLVAVATVLVLFRGDWRALLASFGAFLAALTWWLSLKPSSRRRWQADVAESPWAQVDGNVVTIHNLRHCDYRAQFDYTVRWETRTVDLAKLRGIDVAITHWGSPWLAHPIMSFDFGDDGYVAMSVEVRKEVGETYSALRGFFRNYELIYVISDERDVIRLRTTWRAGEDVYLFRTSATPEGARLVFLDYIRHANRLREQPEWYNAFTNNCTTNIADHIAHARGRRGPFDWRAYLNGKADEMMHERGDLVGGSDFAQLKARAHINAAARAAGSAEDFSRRIREGRPGFEFLAPQL